MSDGDASASNESFASWPSVAGIAAFLVMFLYAHRLYLTGWGDGARKLRDRRGDSYVLFMARIGVVFLPCAYTSGFGLILMVACRVYFDSDSRLALVIACLAAPVTFGCAVWAVKEVLSPSPRRQRPQWVNEMDRGSGSWRA